MISVDSILSDKHDLDKLDDLCRLCGQLKDSSSLIFDINRSNYDSIINSHFKDEFQILKTDVLPLKICNCCLASVESWNKFYISTVEVNEKFLLLIDKFGLTKESKKKPADMMNNDIEVIEVSVEGDNYEFFNEQDNVNEFDITNIKYTHEFVDSNQFGDLVDEDVGMNDCEDRIVEHTSEKDSPSEYNDGNVNNVVIGDGDGLSQNDVARRADARNVTAAAHLLDELTATSYNDDDDGGDENDDNGDDAKLIPPKCMICNEIFYEGQLINDQYICGNCFKVKVEVNDEEANWNYGEVEQPDETNVANVTEMVVDTERGIFYAADKLNEEEMDVDVAMKTLPDEKYQCALCNKVYCKKKSMINHVKNHNKKIFTCKVCNSNFRTQLQLKTHKKRHVRKSLNNTLIYCEICKKYFKTKKGFAYHQQKICIQYKCYICDEKFLVHSVLMDHMRKVHDVVKKPSLTVAVASSGDETVPGAGTTSVNDNETVMSVCPVCGKVVTQAVLPRHMILHSEDKPFTCDMCGKQFKRKHSLQDHIMIEMGMKNYVCDICGMKFLKQGYLNKHVRYHKLNNGEFQGFKCEMCGKSFPEKWRLGVHQRAVHKGGKFSSCKCDICGNMFAERWMVRLHKHMEHNGEEFKEYQCDVCGKKFLEQWMIRSHQRSTHKSGVKKLYCDLCGRSDHLPKDCSHRHALQEVICLLCGEMFSSNFFLKEHVVSAHNFDKLDQENEEKVIEEEPVIDAKELKKNVLYMCAGCGKQFISKQQLRSHEVIANCIKDSKYECQECGKIFHSKSSLSNHLMSHKKAGVPALHRCELCGKEFVTSEALENHMSLDKICLLCDKVYPCNDQLKQHVYTEHQEDEYNNYVSDTKKSRVGRNTSEGSSKTDDDPDTPDDQGTTAAGKINRPFECKLCGKKFARKQAMKNHLFAEMNLRRYVCEFCDKSYNYYSHLKEHIVTNHGEKEFVCGYCGKDFPTKKRFRDHVTLHSEDKPFPCECGLSFKLNRYLSKHKKRCKAMVKKERTE